jgi:hypothetical protein
VVGNRSLDFALVNLGESGDEATDRKIGATLAERSYGAIQLISLNKVILLSIFIVNNRI